ncbi:MAG TPA: PAS domain-containing protein [Stellaceae bacterium]|nr:PAS domain-containing protein [Stellaceae bacterium]
MTMQPAIRRRAPRAASVLGAAGLPAWMRGLIAVAVGSAVLGLGLLVVALTALSGQSLARPLAIVLIFVAAACGLASLAARQVHAALAGRVDLLSQALEASPNAHLVVAPDGSIAYANAAFHRFFPELGNPPLDAIARRFAEDEGAAREFLRLRQDAARSGRAAGRLALRYGAGSTAWFSLSAHLLAGRPGYGLWSFEDVTARHEMEQVIRDEQMKLADFLDNAPTGFYSVDGEGRFLFVNQALADWLGVSAGELVESGAKLKDFLAGEVPSGSPAHAPFEGGAAGAARGEVVLRGRQGRTVYASISQSVVPVGDSLRTRSVVRDLTPEREWEEALRLSRQRFQRFFANAPVGIALLDRQGRLEEANRALGELFGVPPNDLIGKTLVSYLSSDSQTEIQAKLAAAAEGRPFTRPVDVRLSGARDKSAAVFVSRLGAVEEGGEAGVILHFIDTTEQKSLEAQFAQSQKMQAVGQLAGGVAHDFNNLLTAMIGFCDLLLLRFRPGDPSFADIMQIKQNANRAANLVRQLLAFSRQQTLQPRVLNITDVLAELSHLLRRLIGENIELKVVHGRDLGLVKVDQGQLEQVIINLAVNARDAMPGGGTLTIRTANVSSEFPMRRGHEVMPPGEYVLAEVTDTGIGIPRENLARIFEPFFSTKEVGSGTGLGLSTVYGIVKQTGGFVFVDSEAQKGAAFSIFLPRHSGGESLASAKAADLGDAAATRDLTGAGTLLLVEDEDPVRLFSARALRNKGYKVIEAKSGEAALEVITSGSEKVELLITDVVMPRMDGPNLVKHVRELYPEMKVIFISGYTEDAFRKRLDHDADIHFLPKPFSLKQLAGKVKEVMLSGSGD